MSDRLQVAVGDTVFEGDLLAGTHVATLEASRVVLAALAAQMLQEGAQSVAVQVV